MTRRQKTAMTTLVFSHSIVVVVVTLETRR
jgi:hypothetical protein